MAKKQYKRPRNYGDLLRMTEHEVVNIFFDEPHSRAPANRVLNKWMIEDGYTDFWKWARAKIVPAGPAGKSTKSANGYDGDIPETRASETLRRELLAIGASYSFRSVDEPDRCREFCSVKGGVLNMVEDDLTDGQRRMLGLLRYRARKERRR